MERLTKCQVCGRKIAKFTCQKCGSNVCEEHFDAASGLCTACKQGKRV